MGVGGGGGVGDDPHRGRGAAGLTRACPNTGDKKKGEWGWKGSR